MTLNGREVVLPPISLGALRTLQDRLKKVEGAADPFDSEVIDTIIDATFAALHRNYPEMSRNDVADLVDLGNMYEVFQSVMDVSGMLRKQQEANEGKPKAEAP